MTTNITSLTELEEALGRIVESNYGNAGVILEKMVTGHDYRVLATPDEVISVVRRDPAYVVADGRHTVAELVFLANVSRRRNPYLGRHLVRADERTAALLEKQGFTFASVPPVGQIVRITTVANLSQGGISTEVTQSSHPSLHELATRAVSSIPGLPYAGIDVFMQDHTRPVDEQEVTIIEVNHNPALMLHPYPMFGPPQNVSRHLLGIFSAAQGHELGESRDPLTVRLVISGKVQAVGYRQWMAKAASTLELAGWVRNMSGPGRVEAVIHGPAARVASMLRLAFGGPPQAKPIETYVEPIDEVPKPGFAIRHDAEADRD